MAKTKKVKKSKKSLSWQGQLILVILVICGVVFHPTTILLLIGMMPTFVAAYTDRTKEKMRGITVGAMNLAGCTPFILQLWMTEHSVETALSILTDPMVWVIMYVAAGIGYCIEWAIVGTASVFLVERAQIRVKTINKKQEDLVERWGAEVSGTIPLDEYGFPVQQEETDSKNDASAEKT